MTVFESANWSIDGSAFGIMTQSHRRPTHTKPKPAGARLRPTVGVWLAVLGLTVLTSFYFKWKTPDAPLDNVSIVLVAFCWFLLASGVDWVRKWRKERKSAK